MLISRMNQYYPVPFLYVHLYYVRALPYVTMEVCYYEPTFEFISSLMLESHLQGLFSLGINP